MKFSLSVDIAAPVAQVWAYIEPVERHVDWMADAESVEFVTEQRRGVGTVYDCFTRIGPFTTVDRMTCVEWDEGKAMAIRHVGLVTGTGRFVLEPLGPDHTRFHWIEELRFPWQFGGRIGEFFAQPIMRHIWRGNLERLAAGAASTVISGR